MISRIMLLFPILLSSISAEGSWTDLGDVSIPGTPLRINSTDSSYTIDFIPYLWESGPVSTLEIDVLTGRISISEECAEPPVQILFFPMPIRDIDHLQMTIPEGVVRVTPAGDTLWTCIVDTVAGYEGIPQRIQPSENGGCWALFGPEPGSDIWDVIRISSGGDLLSRAEFRLQGGPVISMHSLEETLAGGLVMTGVTDSLGMNLYMVVMKLDQDGREVWRVLESFRFHAGGNLIEIDLEGSIVIAGYTGSEREDGYFMPLSDTDIFLLKLDSTGIEVWRSDFQYPEQNSPVLMMLLDDGGVLVLMAVYDEADSYPRDYHLVRYDHDLRPGLIPS